MSPAQPDSRANVYEALKRSALAWPERTALVDEFGELDYRAFWQAVEEVRERLRGEGVGEGLGVGVVGRNGRAFVIQVIAALGCGAVVMPLAHGLRRAELDAILRDAPVHAIIAGDDVDAALDGPRSLVDVPGVPQHFGLIWTGADRHAPFVPLVPDAAFVRFTSGTTGRSKGVVLLRVDCALP